MHTVLRALALPLLLAALLAATSVLAATSASPTPGKPTPDTPVKMTARQTQINITHDGTDSLGARLSTRLKEFFNASNLFQLNEKDAPKMRILLNTRAEFSDRPGVGSLYTIIWVFSQSEGHLGYLLAHDLGTLTADEVDNLATKIVERTDGIAVKYGYLFQQ